IAILALLLSIGGGNAKAGSLSVVESPSYTDDLKNIVQPGPSGSSHWQKVQDLCVARLDNIGFKTLRENYGSGVNVVATKPGILKPDEHVLISAHYDSIENCPGADDNATGVAAILQIASALSKFSFERTLVVALWDEEERGLIGSRSYAQTAAEHDKEI